MIRPYFYFIFLISGSVFSQNYDSYYIKLHEAKQLILSDSSARSLQKYYQLSLDFDFMFARDVYHAIQLSAQTNDTSLAKHFILRAIQQGVPIKMIKEEQMLSNLLTEKHWSTIMIRHDSLRAVYDGKINRTIREEINSMFVEDQAIRQKYYAWYNLPIKYFINKKWKALNQKQAQRILEITNEYGFPGEKLIGIDELQMHPKINEERLCAGMPIVLLLHYYSDPRPSFNHILFPEIKKGNLLNEHYALISDFQNAYGEKGQSLIPNYTFRFKRNASDDKTVDQRRTEIGLLSLPDQEKFKKIKWLRPFWIYLY